MINGLILSSVLKACGQIHTWEVGYEPRISQAALYKGYTGCFPALLPFHDLPSTFSSLGLPLLVLYPKIWDFLCHTLPHTSQNYACRKKSCKKMGRKNLMEVCTISWGHCSSEWIRRFPFLGILSIFTFLLSPWSQPLPCGDLGTRTQQNWGENNFSLLWALSYPVSLN